MCACAFGAAGYLKPLLPSAAPEDPEDFPSILRDVEAHILPGVLNWQHPRFFGFFPANTSPPGLLADMLSNATGAIGFSWVASPAGTELETITLDWCDRMGQGGGVCVCVWKLCPPTTTHATHTRDKLTDSGCACGHGRLGKLLGLPESFSSSGNGGGIIQCTASDSVWRRVGVTACATAVCCEGVAQLTNVPVFLAGCRCHVGGKAKGVSEAVW